MEFNEVVVKENLGLCRCCLSEGCYKDVCTEYTWMNETEIYAEMLMDCFDISIMQHSDGPNGASRLICEVCITRLRDACNFKKQVQETEKKFIDMISKGEFQPKALQEMKSEVEVEVEPETENTVNAEYLEDEMDFSEAVKEDSDSDYEQPGVSRAATPPKKKRLKKIKIEPPKKGEPRGGQKAKKQSEQEHSDDIETLALEPVAVKPTISAKDKRNIMRKNVLEVLKKSTAMPFRWLKSSYRCFYCYDIFQEVSELKEHQIKHVGDEIKEQTMNNYWEPVVYIDVSHLTCNICSENIADLYDLIDHLISKHGVVYNKDIGLCMVAFKLDNFSVYCLLCGAHFYTFGPLLHHTNKDHKGTSAILCDICGQHFKDNNLLRLHVKTVHENTGLLCPECGEKFETKSKLKTHQKNQHDVQKKYKCSVCSLQFSSHYKRSRHMQTEHNTREQVKCLHCPKTFVFRSMMMTHLRDAHLKVRNHICSVCGFKAFNSNRLKNHMYKHSGEKNFKCDACDKAFTTKKIMRAHFARMHKPGQPPIMQYENPYNMGH